jgi:hypothetical protein
MFTSIVVSMLMESEISWENEVPIVLVYLHSKSTCNNVKEHRFQGRNSQNFLSKILSYNRALVQDLCNRNYQSLMTLRNDLTANKQDIIRLKVTKI